MGAMTQFGQKNITEFLFVVNIFLWMITLITPKMIIIDYQFHSFMTEAVIM